MAEPDAAPGDCRLYLITPPRLDPAAAPAEQGDLVNLFQASDMACHGGLTDRQPLGRSGEAAATHGCVECTQLGQVHGVALNS